MLRLCVDARDIASDTRGIGRYARAILRRLVKRDDIELTLLVHGPFPARHRAKLRATLGSDRFGLSSRTSRCEVVWHPANGTFFAGGPHSVVTIHDAVPFRFPHPDLKQRERQQAPFLRSVRNAQRIIAVSNFDRNELVDVFSLPPNRIEVIYHGVDSFFSPGPSAQPQPVPAAPYLLFVGDPLGEPRKNFAMLYEAYRRAFSANAPLLVVIGPADPKLGGVHYAGLAAGDASGSGDQNLRSVYRGALALCIPSYYETFGMPLAEAMACGTPVIASQAGCLPEIGGDAALYAPPHDVHAWSAALQEIAQNAPLRERLRAAGLERVQRYAWDESARLHAEVFKSL